MITSVITFTRNYLFTILSLSLSSQDPKSLKTGDFTLLVSLFTTEQQQQQVPIAESIALTITVWCENPVFYIATVINNRYGLLMAQQERILL